MGWASGSQLAEELYLAIRDYIDPICRKEVANQFYDKFCDYDADDWTGESLIEKDMKGD